MGKKEETLAEFMSHVGPLIDEDYCITGISSKKFKELFPQAFKRGKALLDKF